MAAKGLTADRKKVLLAAGAAVLLVVLYLRSRGGGAGASTATTDPAATDPTATGSLGGGTGSSGDPSGGAAAGPDPTTLGLLDQLVTTENANAATLSQIGAGIGALIANVPPDPTSTDPTSTDPMPTDPPKPTDPSPPRMPPQKSPKRKPTRIAPKEPGVRRLKSGATLTTTRTGAVIEKAPGHTPYRVSPPRGVHVKPAPKKIPNAYTSGRKRFG